MGKAQVFICRLKGPAKLMALLLLGSCNPFGESSSGICSASGLSTYKFSGTWKKIQGYESPRTEAELETDFHQLIIEPGDRVCEAGISNTVSTGANYRALYLINVNARTVEFQYDEDNLPAPDAEFTTIKYSFSGFCGDTKMLLRYPDGASERFEYLGSEVPVGSCDPE